MTSLGDASETCLKSKLKLRIILEVRAGIYEPQTLAISIGKVTQYKRQGSQLTTDHHVCACACDRAAGKARISPEFSLSTPPVDGAGLETGLVSVFLVTLSLPAESQALCPALCRQQNRYPRPSHKAALLSPPHWVLRG